MANTMARQAEMVAVKRLSLMAKRISRDARVVRRISQSTNTAKLRMVSR
jgi:hypothetical protein